MLRRPPRTPEGLGEGGPQGFAEGGPPGGAEGAPAGPPEEMQEYAPIEGEVSSDDDFEPPMHIPMPDESPRGPANEASGRVLGRTRTTAQVPGHLEPYKETIVIGGDPKKAAPPPPPPGPPSAAGGGEAPPPPPPQPTGPPVDQQIIAQAQMEAQQLMQQAQMQAQQMVADAQANLQQELEAVRQQAAEQGFQEGIQQGVQAGQQQGMAETAQRVEHLKMEFVELVMARRKVLAAMEPEIVHLAVEIAEKIVGMELATGREIITGIVKQALATLKERDEVNIRVNPSEVDAIKANQAAYEAMIEGLKRFEVVPDGAIEAGSCSIETNLGNVDARISTQLEAVRAGLDEMAKIRAFELKDKLSTEPVEVPDDPEFHAKILQAEAEAKAAAAAAAAHH